MNRRRHALVVLALAATSLSSQSRAPQPRVLQTINTRDCCSTWWRACLPTEPDNFGVEGNDEAITDLPR